MSEFQFEIEHLFPRMIPEQEGDVAGFRDERQCCGPSSLGGSVEIVSLKVLPCFWGGCDERT